MGAYANLQSRIADELARSDLTTQIQNAIATAIIYYQDDPFWFNDQEYSFNTVAGTSNYVLPTDYGRDIVTTVTISGNRMELDKKSYTYLRLLQITTTYWGQPQLWAEFEQQMWLQPIPDAIYPVILSYRQDLSTPSDTNGFILNAEELIRLRAKWDIYLNVIHNQKMASQLGGVDGNGGIIQTIYNTYNKKTVWKTATGKVRPSKF